MFKKVGELKVRKEKIKVGGGGIALGHPVGCTGARIVVTLLYEMRRWNMKKGLASLCSAGGMGMTLIVEMLNDIS